MEKQTDKSLTIYILRHGLAGAHKPDPAADARRPLTEEGRRKMKKIAAGFKEIAPHLDKILSSPLPRASQTAKIAARHFPKTPLRFEEALAPGAAPARMEKTLRAERGPRALAVVGHEPGLTQLLSRLLGARRPLPIHLKKGAAACLRREKPGAPFTLQWILTPRQLRALA